MSASPECHDQPTPEDEAAGWRSLAGYLGDQIAELRAMQTRPKLVQVIPYVAPDLLALDSDGGLWLGSFERAPASEEYGYRWERIPGPPDLRP